MRILVVEDEDVVARAVKDALEASGCLKATPRPFSNEHQEVSIMRVLAPRVVVIASIVWCAMFAGAGGGVASAATPTFNPHNFSGHSVDNPWFPLTPGTILVYKGVKDGKRGTDIVRVTWRTRVVDGVRATIVEDTTTLNGRLSEHTFDWYAQDDFGNVVARYDGCSGHCEYAFAAHMDHPGFVGDEFLGGVPESYREKKPPTRDFGAFAMWNLPACEVRDGRIYSRACDDL
jgi:hypothetical protein